MVAPGHDEYVGGLDLLCCSFSVVVMLGNPSFYRPIVDSVWWLALTLINGRISGSSTLTLDSHIAKARMAARRKESDILQTGPVAGLSEIAIGPSKYLNLMSPNLEKEK